MNGQANLSITHHHLNGSSRLILHVHEQFKKMIEHFDTSEFIEITPHEGTYVRVEKQCFACWQQWWWVHVWAMSHHHVLYLVFLPQCMPPCLMENTVCEHAADCENNYMQHQLLNPGMTKDISVMNAIICASKRIGQKKKKKINW